MQVAGCHNGRADHRDALLNGFDALVHALNKCRERAAVDRPRAAQLLQIQYHYARALSGCNGHGPQVAQA